MAKEKEKDAKAAEPAKPVDAQAVRNQFKSEIAAMSIAEFRENFGGLYQRLFEAAREQHKPASLKVPGFMLEAGDAFAEGAARVYAQQKGIDTPRLPIVLPDGDPASVPALKSYIVRAEGGGAYEQAKAARAALAKSE